MLTFLSAILSFLEKVLSLEIVTGITLGTIFFFNMVLISFWAVFTRRA